MAELTGSLLELGKIAENGPEGGLLGLVGGVLGGQEALYEAISLGSRAQFYYETDVRERLAAGNCLIASWPHISFWDIPLVMQGIANAGKPFAEIIPIVAKLPGIVMPRQSITVHFNEQEDIQPLLADKNPYNRHAALGNQWLSHVLGGTFLMSDEQRRQKNSQMLAQAVDSLAAKKNVVIWPSGANMIGKMHNGVARIILQAQDRGQTLPQVVFCHSFTLPEVITANLQRKASTRPALVFSSGLEANFALANINMATQAENPANAQQLLQRLQSEFYCQWQDCVLPAMQTLNYDGQILSEFARFYDTNFVT